ncbi:MAG TPA: aminotransferase class V-fold PLP-dependent enzyme, partial [Thiotrichales bacterium]|nr:aminotransferase class V-fold PLP-dependent enzyme [Thiotrichales bacterium]
RYGEWLQTETRLRRQLASLIQADSSDEIAIVKNTSEGLSVIAQGLNWTAGDNIVIAAEEFPSNRIAWQALAPLGVETRLVDISHAATAEQRLIEAMDASTKLLSCSSVQYASGLRLDLQQLGQACKKNNSLFCVDAIQSLGAIQFDVNAVQADFVVADGHKWLCAPEGTALFYCRRNVMPLLQLHQFGWHMVDRPYDFNQPDWQPATTAQRFECGSPNMMGITALSQSLAVLSETGMAIIEKQVLNNSEYLFEVLSAMDNIEILTSQLSGKYAGIVSFRRNDVDNESLYDFLQENNVICAYRGAGIRFSPHYYTKTSDIDQALELVRGYR